MHYIALNTIILCDFNDLVQCFEYLAYHNLVLKLKVRYPENFQQFLFVFIKTIIPTTGGNISLHDLIKMFYIMQLT